MTVRRRLLLLALAALLVVPVPHTWSGYDRDPGSGCTTRRWEGWTTLPFSALARVTDAPPAFGVATMIHDVCV